MNDKKIAFITCVNDDMMYEECLRYINNLDIPSGYEIDVISIKEAKCITAAYNGAIKNTDAKYKVYLHQDTFIINRNFIHDILKIFKEDEKVGMIGVVGSKTIPTNGVWWESQQKYGNVYENHTGNMELLNFNEVINEYEEVKAIDGLIMVTQYDVTWREDIFDGWHFYDISQSLEFDLAGYKIVIPKQNELWCVHDCGLIKIVDDYEKYMRLFVKEYERYIIKPCIIIVPENILELKSKLNNYRNYEVIVYDQFNNKYIEKYLREVYSNKYKYYNKQNFKYLINYIIDNLNGFINENKLLLIDNDFSDINWNSIMLQLEYMFIGIDLQQNLIKYIENSYLGLNFKNNLESLKILQQLINCKYLVRNLYNKTEITEYFNSIIYNLKYKYNNEFDKCRDYDIIEKKFEIKNNSKVYILTPPGATGGIELLYQLCHNLIAKGVNAHIVHTTDVNEVHEFYRHYNVKIAKFVEDESDNVFIVPEVFTGEVYRYNNIQKIIWWLSVDNYEVSKKYDNIAYTLGFKKIFDIRNRETNNINLHLVQSNYAKDFLATRGIHNVEYLKDYLNESFFLENNEGRVKKDIILYNPKKGFEFTKNIIEYAPEFKWVAIENMTPKEVAQLLRKSKVYIDFGNHPGKDRIPREAAISGCCIITGRRGAANYKEDIDIGEEFKFEDIEENIPQIVSKIDKCINNYYEENLKFDNYRKKIANEYNEFISDIDKIFLYRKK